MALFKKKQTKDAEKVLNKIQARVVANLAGPDAFSRQTNYNVIIEAHMADLVNFGVNEIAIFVESRVEGSKAGNSVSAINSFLQKEKSSAGNISRKKVGSIDPKDFISHAALASLPSAGAKKANSVLNNLPTAASENINIQDNLIQTKTVYRERKIDTVLARDIVTPERIESGLETFGRGRHSTPPNEYLDKGIIGDERSSFTGNGSNINSNTTPPTVKNQTSTVIPGVTTRIITVSVDINHEISVELLNTSGAVIGRVKNEATGLIRQQNRSVPLRNIEFFRLLETHGVIFDMATNDVNGQKRFVVKTQFKASFSGYCLYARKFSKNPEQDVYINFGDFSINDTELYLPTVDWNCSYIFHVIPLSVDGIKLSYSEMYYHRGEMDHEYDVNHASVVANDSVQFYLENIAEDATHLFAFRTDEASGNTVRLPRLTLNVGRPRRSLDQKRAQKKRITAYTDAGISQTNKTYSYDFFIQNRLGFEKHLFRSTVRTFERDATDLKIKKINLSRSPRGNHVIRVVAIYPDAFVPSVPYSLVNPDDDFFEACRSGKRVALLRIVRHSLSGTSDDLGIHTLTPGELNTLEADIRNNKEFTVNLEIDAAFLRENNVRPVFNTKDTYYYEVRIGSYLLSNELSLRPLPLKLNVPNEFTDGKTGYQYHPILHDGPLRSDYGIIGKLGANRNKFLLESLTSKSRILVSRPKPPEFNKSIELNTKLVPFNYGGVGEGVIVQTILNDALVNYCDHFELMCGDSTSGTFTSLGKFKLVDKNFYFIDVYGPKLAANKLRYMLIARDTAFKNIFTIKSDPIDISQTNIVIESNEELNMTKGDIATEQRRRGF